MLELYDDIAEAKESRLAAVASDEYDFNGEKSAKSVFRKYGGEESEQILLLGARGALPRAAEAARPVARYEGQGAGFTNEALDLVECLDSYTEVSSSGTCLHIIAEGEHLDNRKTRVNLVEAGHLEVYDESRYFALTGNLFNGPETVESCPKAIRGVSPRSQQQPFCGHTEVYE